MPNRNPLVDSRRVLVAAIEQQREHRWALKERGEPTVDVTTEIYRLVGRLNILDKRIGREA